MDFSSRALYITILVSIISMIIIAFIVSGITYYKNIPLNASHAYFLNQNDSQKTVLVSKKYKHTAIGSFAALTAIQSLIKDGKTLESRDLCDFVVAHTKYRFLRENALFLKAFSFECEKQYDLALENYNKVMQTIQDQTIRMEIIAGKARIFASQKRLPEALVELDSLSNSLQPNTLYAQFIKNKRALYQGMQSRA